MTKAEAFARAIAQVEALVTPELRERWRQARLENIFLDRYPDLRVEAGPQFIGRCTSTISRFPGE